MDPSADVDARDPQPSVPSMDAIEFKGSRVIVRVDINAPVEDGKVAGTSRLDAAARSIEALVDRGAGVVVLGHQGRPGRDDFTSLEQHAGLISQQIAPEVRFVPHVDDADALSAVESVEPGEVLLLENVRKADGEIENLRPEEHAERAWVRRLAGGADAFVLDGFSVSHRSHASIVGFPLLLPGCAGPLMQRELDALERVEEPDREDRRVLILGGTKVDDALDVIEHHLESQLADLVLTGGIVGEAFLHGRGTDLGDATIAVMDKHGAFDRMDQVEDLMDRFDERIATPVDLAYGDDGRLDLALDDLPVETPILDIGPETAETYAQEVHDADAVVFNGPLGAYERDGFATGTERVLNAMATADAFTLLGGGHTVTAMERAGWRRDDFSHVSLAGGALVTYLTGGRLPGLQGLAESARRFALADGHR